jgi:hypothetical protein
MTIQKFKVSHEELEFLISACQTVHCDYLTGDLIWDTSKPIPEAVKKLGIYRGLSEEDFVKFE